MPLEESPHDKTNKMACAPSEDSDQYGYPPSMIRVFAVAWRNLGSFATHKAHSEDSYQTGRMPRLIWVFGGRTCHFVGFDMRRLRIFRCISSENDLNDFYHLSYKIDH